MRRVIRGVDKFTIRSGHPFIVECNHESGTAANIMSIGQTGGGDRVRDARDPAPTGVTKQEACVVAANIIQYHTEQTENVRANGLRMPLPTVDASNRYGLTTAQLVEYFGNGQPIDVRKPMHTVTSHDREAIVCAHICKYYGGVIGAEAQEPLPTVTAVDHNAVAAAHIVEFKGRDIGQDADRPLRTITASAGEFADCRAELMEIGGGLYFIADILLRMLTPRELYNAMGFPPDYIIDRDYLGNEYGKTKQVARCGNAVCPPMATALVRANLPEWCSRTITTMEELEKAVTA